MLIPIIAADAADVFRLPLILGDRARAMFLSNVHPFIILHLQSNKIGILPARILKYVLLASHIPPVQWIRAMKTERGRGDGFFRTLDTHVSHLHSTPLHFDFFR